MVFVNDFRSQFYDKLQNQRVLVLVGMDVDALCACQIIKSLFQCDQVLYTVVPVSGFQDLEMAYAEHSEGIRHVVLINCGATVDLIGLIQPPDGVVFYVCDSHRPVDVHNIYNQIQVQLLMNQDELENVPDYEQLFREEDDSDSGNDSDSSSENKRPRFNEESLERRRNRRVWEEERKTHLFEYTKYSSFGTSAAFLMFELAWKMSKDTNDLLWLSIIGVTSQFICNQVERDKYIEDIGQLQGHVSRHNHRPDTEENPLSIDTLKISFAQEIRLMMYRHWTLLDSISHSTNVACKFKLWGSKGKNKLHEYLADMGLPLAQCEQRFSAMEVKLKEKLKDRLATDPNKYNLEDTDLYLPSFNAQYGFKHKFCAADIVYACEAVLEAVEKDMTFSDSFLNALDVLKRSNTDSLQKAMDFAKLQMKAISTQTQSLLDMNQIICAGPFLYAFLAEGNADVKLFSKPQCLQKLAHFALHAYSCMSRNKKALKLPLVLGAPLNTEEGTMMIIGIPPVIDRSCKNLFGKAFEQAAKATYSEAIQDLFDMHIIAIKSGDKGKFFDALVSLLQQ